MGKREMMEEGFSELVNAKSFLDWIVKLIMLMAAPVLCAAALVFTFGIMVLMLSVVGVGFLLAAAGVFVACAGGIVCVLVGTLGVWKKPAVVGADATPECLREPYEGRK
jgi:hypothetical protein